MRPNRKIRAASAKTSPSTLLFLQTRLSKNRPSLSETGRPPSRSIYSLGRNRLTGQAGGPYCLSGTPNRRGERTQALRPMEGLIYAAPATLSTAVTPARRRFFRGTSAVHNANPPNSPRFVARCARRGRRASPPLAHDRRGRRSQEGGRRRFGEGADPARLTPSLAACQDGHEEAKFLRFSQATARDGMETGACQL
jgi:hypothetical protein